MFQIGNSNVSISSGSVIAACNNGKNSYVMTSFATSNTIRCFYPGIDSNLVRVPIQVYSQTKTSNLRVSSAAANTIRFSTKRHHKFKCLLYII
jgi:hypothetical protein